jgi:hypothetical protein
MQVFFGVAEWTAENEASGSIAGHFFFIEKNINRTSPLSTGKTDQRANRSACNPHAIVQARNLEERLCTIHRTAHSVRTWHSAKIQLLSTSLDLVGGAVEHATQQATGQAVNDAAWSSRFQHDACQGAGAASPARLRCGRFRRGRGPEQTQYKHGDDKFLAHGSQRVHIGRSRIVYPI